MAEIRNEVLFPIDEAGRKRVIAALLELEKKQKDAGAAALKSGKGYESAAKAIAGFQKEQRDLLKSLKAVDPAIERQARELLGWTKAVDEADDAAENLENRLKRLDDEFSKVSQQVGQAGDIESGIRTIGGAAGAIPGLGGVGGAAGGAGEIFAVIEAAPKLRASLKGLPDILQKSAEASGLGGLAGKLEILAPGLGATGASVAALTAVVLPVVAIAAAAAVALKLYNDAILEVTEATRAAAEVRQIERDAIRSIQELLQAGEIEAALEQRNQLFREAALAARDIAAEEEVLLKLREREASELSNPRIRAAGLDTVTALREQQNIVNEMADNSVRAIAALKAADDALSGLTDTEIQAALGADELEKSLAATTGELQKLESQQQTTAATLQRLAQQTEQVQASFAQSESDRLEDTSLAEQFAFEDRLLAADAFQQSLVAIEQAGNAKIEQLRTELADLPGERLQAITEAEGQANAKLTDLRQEFMADSLDDLKKFQAQEKRTQQRGQIDRLRLLQDLQDTLNGAQRDNDVIAFLQAQRAGEKQLSRQSQDAGIADRQRADDFASENQARRAALQERIADVEANLQEERAAINVQFTERRQALLESIDAEKQAIEERTQAAIDAQERQAENAERQADRQDQRETITARRRERNHAAQLARIDERTRAEQQALNTILAQLRQVQQQAAADLSRPPSSTSLGNRTTSSGSRLTPFQHGGVVRGGNPIAAMLGDTPSGIDELVLPFRRSDGVPRMKGGGRGGGGGVQIVLNQTLAPTIGDISSKAEVTQALRDFAIAFGQSEIRKAERMLQP